MHAVTCPPRQPLGCTCPALPPSPCTLTAMLWPPCPSVGLPHSKRSFKNADQTISMPCYEPPIHPSVHPTTLIWFTKGIRQPRRFGPAPKKLTSQREKGRRMNTQAVLGVERKAHGGKEGDHVCTQVARA